MGVVIRNEEGLIMGVMSKKPTLPAKGHGGGSEGIGGRYLASMGSGIQGHRVGK